MKSIFIMAAIACLALVASPVIANAAPIHTELISVKASVQVYTSMQSVAIEAPACVVIVRHETFVAHKNLDGLTFVAASQPMNAGATPMQPRYKLRC